VSAIAPIQPPPHAALSASIAADLGALTVALREMPPGLEASSAVSDWLYQNWYLNVRPAERRSGAPLPAEVDLVAALEAAHAGSIRFEPGWVADRVSSSGRVEAARGRHRRVVGAGQYVDVDRPVGQPEPGDRLRVVTGLTSIEGGFWILRTWSYLEGGEQPLTRLYVNARLPGAPSAVALLTEALLDTKEPFALKVCLQLSDIQRADSLVVYVPRDRYAAVRDAIAAAVAELGAAGLLAPEIPRLTAPLCAGVAAADGEGAGSSYGQTRCAILAEALLDAHSADAEAIEDRTIAAFEAAGLDPSRPYLAAGATHDYAPFA
jgi:hypothetical protein